MCWPSTGAGTDQNIASTVSFDQQVSGISDGIAVIKDIKVRKMLFSFQFFLPKSYTGSEITRESKVYFHWNMILKFSYFQNNVANAQE